MFSKFPFLKFLLKTILFIWISVTSFFLSFFFFFLAVVAGVVILGVIATSAGDGSDEKKYTTIYGKEDAKNTFLSVKVNGLILGQKDEISDPFSLLEGGITYGYEIKKILRDAAEDADIKGVILEVNSPGGTIYGAHAIADGIAYYKQKTQKPVITHILGLSASGGYWASVATDYVTADYGSTIGSIGVIFGPFKYYDKVVSEDDGVFIGGVVTQNGIETTYFTAGKSKDIGNPYRKLTPDEVKVLQESVNNEYSEFVKYVAKRRSLSEDTIRNQIGALIYDNKSAKDLGLIDTTMNKEEAYGLLAKRSGIVDSDYQIVIPESSSSFFGSLLQTFGKNTQPKVSAACHLSTTILVFHGDTATLCK